MVFIETLHVFDRSTLKKDDQREERKIVCLLLPQFEVGIIVLLKRMEYITKMPKQTSDNIQSLLKVLILATIAAAAISSRLFSVIRYPHSTKESHQLLVLNQ
jgi:hypothetical protein